MYEKASSRFPVTVKAWANLAKRFAVSLSLGGGLIAVQKVGRDAFCLPSTLGPGALRLAAEIEATPRRAAASSRITRMFDGCCRSSNRPRLWFWFGYEGVTSSEEWKPSCDDCRKWKKMMSPESLVSYMRIVMALLILGTLEQSDIYMYLHQSTSGTLKLHIPLNPPSSSARSWCQSARSYWEMIDIESLILCAKGTMHLGNDCYTEALRAIYTRHTSQYNLGSRVPGGQAFSFKCRPRVFTWAPN